MTRDLASAFLALSRRWPNNPAIESASQKLTYMEMMKSAGAMADILAIQNIKAGSRIGIALSRNEDAFIIMLAVWLLGATVLVTDFRSRAAERRKLAETLDLEFFVEDRPAPGVGEYPAFRLDVNVLYEGLNERPLPHPPGMDASPIAVIGISSGTSGMPQPVALSHECLFARYAIARMSPQWNVGGRFAVSAPLAFSATRKHVISRLLDGGTVIFLPLMVSAHEFAEFVISTKADAVLMVPSILRELLPLAPPNGVLFPHVSWLMSCGAPMLPQEKLDARSRLSSGFVQNYGSTMAGMVTMLETHDIDLHADSVGRPLPHVLVEIVDAEGNQLPAGEAGIIRIRTPGTAENLPGKGDLSARQSDLIIDGWVYPGDIGYLDQDGFLTIVARSSDVIIRGGVNVFPSEVEEILAGHAAVEEAAVVGWPDPLLGEEIAAFVVLKEHATPQEIIAWCRSRIQPDKQPREIFIVQAMPRNANGKLIRRDLVASLTER